MNDPATASPIFTLPSLALAWNVSDDTLRRVLRSRADLLALGTRAGIVRVYTPTEAGTLKAAVDAYLLRPRARMHRKATA